MRSYKIAGYVISYFLYLFFLCSILIGSYFGVGCFCLLASTTRVQNLVLTSGFQAKLFAPFITSTLPVWSDSRPETILFFVCVNPERK